MEAEKKETLQGKREIKIGPMMNRMVDLETEDPNLMITIYNNGPAREIECYITDQQSRPDRIQKVYNGNEVTIRLGDQGKGKFLALINKDSQTTSVFVNW